MLSRRGFIEASATMFLPETAPGESLCHIAARKGLLFGSEITVADIAGSTAYRALARTHCDIITPGLEAKWGAVEPEEGTFSFAPLDRIVAFAESAGMAVHMHNLLWSVGLPDWTVQALACGRGAEVMVGHIAALAGRYRGQVSAWDVVNEPVDPRWPSGPEGLCNTPWRRGLGAGYVIDALRATGAADPQARLLINDDDLEYDLPDREAKRCTYLRLIESWLRAGANLHGFGLEAHLKPWLPIAEKSYRRFLHELADFGLLLYVTELDVCDRTLPPDIAARDLAVADYARRYLDITLDETAVRTVIVWGLSDRHTYMHRDPATRRQDGLASRPCPFDTDFAPKPFFYAILHALANTHVRKMLPGIQP
jgi:endo-1,4-beta-xylanase